MTKDEMREKLEDQEALLKQYREALESLECGPNCGRYGYVVADCPRCYLLKEDL